MSGQYGNGTTGLGYQALASQVASIIGKDNTAYGSGALSDLNGGVNENTAIGSNSLASNNSGENTALGAYSGANVTGTKNTMGGNWAMRYMSGGDDNTAFGHRSMAGDENTNNAPSSLSNGIGNTAYGSGTMQFRPEGMFNTGIGYRSMHSIKGKDARFNTGVGYRTLINVRGHIPGEGFNNTAIGSDSLKNITKGSRNTGCGAKTGNGVTIGSSCTFIGHNADVGTNPSDPNPLSASFRTAIGADSKVEKDNSIVLGRIIDMIGIRTTKPLAALNVNSGNATDISILSETSGNGDAIKATTNNSGNALHGISTGSGSALMTEGGHVYSTRMFQALALPFGANICTVSSNDHIVLITDSVLPTASIVNMPHPATLKNGQILNVRNASTNTATLVVTASPIIFYILGVAVPSSSDVIPVGGFASYVAHDGFYYRFA